MIPLFQHAILTINISINNKALSKMILLVRFVPLLQQILSYKALSIFYQTIPGKEREEALQTKHRIHAIFPSFVQLSFTVHSGEHLLPQSSSFLVHVINARSDVFVQITLASMP